MLAERGIWVTEACDSCGKLLGSVRWTRKSEPGEWCSAECRDGIAIPETASNVQAKRCLECGVPLHGKRSDSEFCSDVHSKRYRRRHKSSASKKCRNSPDTSIRKQGLTEAQNGGLTDTPTAPTQALETAVSARWPLMRLANCPVPRQWHCLHCRRELVIIEPDSEPPESLLRRSLVAEHYGCVNCGFVFVDDDGKLFTCRNPVQDVPGWAMAHHARVYAERKKSRDPGPDQKWKCPDCQIALTSTREGFRCSRCGFTFQSPVPEGRCYCCPGGISRGNAECARWRKNSSRRS